jgi:hypothetical protein
VEGAVTLSAIVMKGAPAAWSNCVYLMEQIRSVDEREDAGNQLSVKKEDIVDFYGAELKENRSRSQEGTKSQ